MLEADAVATYPPEVPIAADRVATEVAASHRVLVVLDDDPTGTQSVADLPVLTRWEVDDFRWAFSQDATAIYVLTNSRSLDPQEAERCNREVVSNALTAAAGRELAFVSRSDSTLRGHFPLEPDTIAAVLQQEAGIGTDAVVIVPAFPDAGRVTIGGTHYMRDDEDGLTPVADSEFARDATFGFSRSFLPDYVEEKSQGRYAAADVIVLDLKIIRSGSAGIAAALSSVTDSTPVVADIVTENDLRALSLGLAEAERRGKRLLYRVGPPFVRARIGQEIRQPLTAHEIFTDPNASPSGGLIVVGSHVAQTTRQLRQLIQHHPGSLAVELDVEALLGGAGPMTEVGRVVAEVVAGLRSGDVILHTSRLLVRDDDAATSLRIARAVSAAVVEVVRGTLDQQPPRFVIAKGGISSSDVATHGLQIRHAIVRGPMLPGIVSLWEPVDGPAQGIPYVVFAGNVGDDHSLVEVVGTLSSTD